ncbi:four helix bundle protein [Mariprofundus ferrooxydans]|uniref:four helix bundle protein n=1 Tax=Mariprofundus ferrooxydans TaxID=314344 RepID=UPI0014308AD0|nr:four helix bundle protein [Mariprofundus ferrooxydans]
MTSFERFEDIDAWKRARILTNEIYALTRQGEFSRDYGLTDQIRRAAVSVMSNLAEGFERNSGKEFARFLDIAKGSAGEIRCQLYIATDQGYLDMAQSGKLISEVSEISRMIAGLIKYLRSNKESG